MGKIGISRYFADEAAFKEGVMRLENEGGYRPIQRPHRKLPALMRHWDNLLKESGQPVLWFSKKIKGRRTVVYAVAGTHYYNDGGIAYCYRIFGDYETKKYAKTH